MISNKNHLCAYYGIEVIFMECLEYYTVKRGDTFFSIAEKIGTSVERLISLNPAVDPENLSEGQVICTRSAQSTGGSCPFGTIPYTISQGDTLRELALRFDTTVEALKNANPDVNPNDLTVGQRICIAQPISELPRCPSENFYVIRRGDTVRSIAAAFEVTSRELLTINPRLNPNNMTVGQVICIPLAPSSVEIIININAKRLAVYKNGKLFRQYVVATGKEETPTPTGAFTLINKQVNPGGPYGTRWLGLSKRGYGIHGTNEPSSIGENASNGCVRMFNEDVEALFDIVPVGTVVRILP